jgi:hypothetical protein
MDAQRQILDELMGRDRNLPLPMRQQKKLTWDDPGVCKYNICGLCPSRLFKNTKSDLGAKGDLASSNVSLQPDVVPFPQPVCCP